MNHNFLPFEVTELLPKENPYNKLCFFFKDKDNNYKIAEQSYCNLVMKLKGYDGFIPLEYSGKKIRDAWTIIDALTWLEEQDYVVEAISTNAYSNKQWQCVITNLHINIEHDIETIFESRIKAYIAGIKHCLELINQNKNAR